MRPRLWWLLACWAIPAAPILWGCASTPQRANVDNSPGASSQPPEPAPEMSTSASAIDAPEISRSVGVEGGVVIFWPRITPASASDEMRESAKLVQNRLRTLVQAAFPEKKIDVRPEPQRVCPQSGCLAMTVGAIVSRDDGGCLAVLLVSRPGASPTTLVPWVGRVKLEATTSPFRDSPESYVRVLDFEPCENFPAALMTNEEGLIAQIRAHAQ